MFPLPPQNTIPTTILSLLKTSKTVFEGKQSSHLTNTQMKMSKFFESNLTEFKHTSHIETYKYTNIHTRKERLAKLYDFKKS